MVLIRQDYGEKRCRFGRLIQLPEYGFNRPLSAAQSEAIVVSADPATLVQAPDHLAVRRKSALRTSFASSALSFRIMASYRAGRQWLLGKLSLPA
jgi:hypothetical protein